MSSRDLGFLRYAGGKSGLVETMAGILPREIPSFREIFFGSGKLLFRLASEYRIGRAHLSDLNWRIMAAHRAVSAHLAEVVKLLSVRPNTPEEYAIARMALNAARPGYDSIVTVGALVIQLNRAGFNGLWRENSSGEYNTPYGGGGREILDPRFERRLIAAYEAFESTDAHFASVDYGFALLAAEAGDLVYADPPYLPRAQNSFTSYVGGRTFDEAEHRRLALCLAAAGARGVKFLLSSSDTPLAREIYGGLGEVLEVSVRRAINRDGKGRGPVGELLVKNF